VGPVCVRRVQVGLVSTRRDCTHAQFFSTLSPTIFDQVPTHRYSISMRAPLDEAEHGVEEILRHFNQIEQNLDACRVYLEVA